MGIGNDRNENILKTLLKESEESYEDVAKEMRKLIKDLDKEN